MTINFSVVIISFVLASNAFAGDFFNCSDQKYRMAKMICSSTTLVSLATQEEQSTNKAYAAANKARLLATALQYKRIDWLEKIRKNCHTLDLITDSSSFQLNQTDLDCLKAAFTERNTELGQILQNGFLRPGFKQLSISNAPPDNSVLRGAEIIFISGYNPIRSEGQVNIDVDREGKKVVLIVNSYDSTLWNVKVSKNTNLVAVILGKGPSYQDHSVASNKEIPLFQMELDLPYETENIKFQNAMEKLHNYFDLNSVDYFQGSSELPPSIKINEMQAPSETLTYLGPKAKKLNKNLTFDLINLSFDAIKWSLDGTQKENVRKRYIVKGVASSSDHKKYFKLVRGEIEVEDSVLGTVSLPPMPNEFPKFSELKDIALDTKRNILLLVSDEHLGSFYRFDISAKKWLGFNKLVGPSPHKNAPFNFLSLAYDEKADRYIGWGRDMGRECILIFISPDGEYIGKENISNLLPGFERLYDRQNGGITPMIKVIPQGDNLILVNIKEGYVSRIWHYDLGTKIGTLTYANRTQFVQQ